MTCPWWWTSLVACSVPTSPSSYRRSPTGHCSVTSSAGGLAWGSWPLWQWVLPPCLIPCSCSCCRSHHLEKQKVLSQTSGEAQVLSPDHSSCCTRRLSFRMRLCAFVTFVAKFTVVGLP